MIHIAPDMSQGIIREKDGKRFFLRLWPGPAFLQECRAGEWHDVEDVGDDFNLTVLVEARDNLRSRLATDHSSLVESIVQGQQFLEGFDLPTELLPLLRLQRRIEQREGFLSAVPSAMLETVRRFPESHFALLKLFAWHEEALEMAGTNPALAFLVATREKWRSESGMPPIPAPGTILRSKRTAMVKALGFANASQSLVRVLGKLSPWACRVDLIAGLRQVLRKGEGIERLRHLPEINFGSLAVASDETLLERIADSVLLEIAASEEEARAPRTAMKLKSCLALEEAGRLPRSPRVFHSIHKIHKTVLEGAESMTPEEIEALGLELPTPPLPDTPQIQALRSVADVFEEACVQENCVWSLLPRLVSGKLFLYRLLAPERATLALRRQGGICCIDELEGACNEPVSTDTAAHVQRWIDETGCVAIDTTCGLFPGLHDSRKGNLNA